MLLEDAIDYLVELLGIFRPMDNDSVLLGIRGKLIQVFIEMGDGMTLDGRSLVAQLFPLVKPLSHVVTLCADSPKRGVVPLRVSLVLQELRGFLAMLC